MCFAPWRRALVLMTAPGRGVAGAEMSDSAAVDSGESVAALAALVLEAWLLTVLLSWRRPCGRVEDVARAYVLYSRVSRSFKC